MGARLRVSRLQSLRHASVCNLQVKASSRGEKAGWLANRRSLACYASEGWWALVDSNRCPRRVKPTHMTVSSRPTAVLLGVPVSPNSRLWRPSPPCFRIRCTLLPSGSVLLELAHGVMLRPHRTGEIGTRFARSTCVRTSPGSCAEVPHLRASGLRLPAADRESADRSTQA